MQSQAKTLDAYLAEVPADRLEALRHIRQLCLEELPGYAELMAYGGPCYAKNDVVEVVRKMLAGTYLSTNVICG